MHFYKKTESAALLSMSHITKSASIFSIIECFLESVQGHTLQEQLKLCKK